MNLPARIEAMTGPSREMDAEIAALVSTDPTSRVVWFKGRRRYLSAGAGRLPMHVGGGKGTKWGIVYQTKPYTASIDAAVSLVPAGHCWTLKDYGTPKCVAQIGALIQSSAATPALALCAAALRARSLT
ncbi:MAG: hypothetical protein V4696_07375 [Pseudomonadota bacterium]